MTCDAVKDLLDAFVDGEIETGERSAVLAHLSTCAACRREELALRSLLARAAALPREIAPRSDLWPAVAGGIAPLVVAFPKRFLRSAVPLAAAAAALVALSSAVTWRVATSRDAGAREARVASAGFAVLVAASDPSDLFESEREYARATRDLLAAIEARRGALSPETIAAIELNVKVIDDALHNLRVALKADPENGELRQLLTGTHKRKLETLRRIARLSKL